MKNTVVNKFDFYIAGYGESQHIVIVDISNEEILVKLQFNYNKDFKGQVNERTYLYSPFFTADNFEKIKNECRDEFRTWLKDFDEHYNKYYNYTFFMALHQNVRLTINKPINGY